MPLIKSSSKAAFSQNVSEMMHAGHPQNQALAAAYRIKRRGKQTGGVAEPDPEAQRILDQARMRNLVTHYTGKRQPRADGGRVHVGSIMSAVPGRTDLHPMNVKAGSYVFPADHVSHLGQNNSIAGLDKLNKMFKMGPYGAPAMPLKHGRAHLPRPPHLMKTSTGGAAGDGVGESTEINAAGGEFVVPPEKIMQWMSENGFKPDIDAGHKELDKWVVDTRKDHHKTLSKLPGPAKS